MLRETRYKGARVLIEYELHNDHDSLDLSVKFRHKSYAMKILSSGLPWVVK